MCVPLLESDFLLHLPDLYHEIAHPLISSDNEPKVENFRKNLGEFNNYSIQYFERKISSDIRNNNSKFKRYYEYWQNAWVKAWSTELFCDLFATFVLGPAFGWANLHLCVKTGNDCFYTQTVGNTTHPADHTRMLAIMHALDLINFENEKIKINEYWNYFIDKSNNKKEPLFDMAYPSELIEQCSVFALKATKSVGCKIVTKDTKGEIINLLTNAWKQYLFNPSQYVQWEKKVVNSLIDSFKVK